MDTKKYLVIGGSSGIGHSLCQMLADAGHQVIATATGRTDYETINGVEYHQLNVMANDWSLDFIEGAIDGLVYCPGSIDLKPFSRIKPNQFEVDYRLQVVGAVQCIQQALPNLKLSENASIVLFSTVAVQKGYPFHALVSSSKGAVEGLTKALAAELSPTVRVNCIAPSLTNTRMSQRLLNSEEKKQKMDALNPMKRVGEPEDIAAMAEYLLSDKASWVTGQVLAIDGGASVL